MIVWLEETGGEVFCRFAFKGKLPVDIELKSLNMMAAQREVTAYLKEKNFAPLGRWAPINGKYKRTYLERK